MQTFFGKVFLGCTATKKTKTRAYWANGQTLILVGEPIKESIRTPVNRRKTLTGM